MFNRSGHNTLIRQAFKQAATGHLDEAMASLRTERARGDAHGNLAEAIGAMLFQRASWAEAADAYHEALAADPKNRSRLHFLAYALARAGRWDDATATLNQAAAANRDNVGPLSTRCLLELERGDIPTAQQTYEALRDILRRCPAQDGYSMGLMDQCAELLLDLAKAPSTQKPQQ